jgi:hypothetical protein
MIVREFYATRFDGVNLFKTYSDKGYYIKQMPTGVLYEMAVDIENASFYYEETNVTIEQTEV